MSFNRPYQGCSSKLILAFDIGVTFSKVSYSIVSPGEIPKVLAVVRYPAQEHVGGDNKIPSILYYDQEGEVKAIGAEASQEYIKEQAEEQGWIKLEWWKLHLRNKHLASSAHINVPPLPESKTIVQILADFLQYLFTCAHRYIIESHVGGASLWESVESNIEYFLTHPDGWDGQQLLRAAVIALLIPLSNSEDLNRVHLLTEGKALAHFCIHAFLSDGGLDQISESASVSGEDIKESDGDGIVVINAGDGTIDLNAFSVKLSPPREFEEIAAIECLLQGSVFVTQRAHTYLKSKLAYSRYGSPDIIEQMRDIFDKTVKLRFHDAFKAEYIKFGTLRDRDTQHNIRSGCLKLEGPEVAKFFEPSVEAIADAFERQRRAASREKIQIRYAFLVGNFATSDFLYHCLQMHLAFSEVNVYRPRSFTSMGISDGAVISYLDSLYHESTTTRNYQSL